VNGLPEDTTFQRVAIDAALGVDLVEQERDTKKREPSQTAAHGTSLLVAQRLHWIEMRGSGRRVESR
jgi:hypothetical protein